LADCAGFISFGQRTLLRLFCLKGESSPLLFSHFFEGLLWALFLIEPDGFLNLFTTPIKAIVSTSKEGGQLVIFHLSRVIEGVIMTLGAADLLAEKNLDSVTYVIKKHSTIAEVVSGRRIFGDMPFGGEHLLNHPIIGHVILDGIFQPNVPTETVVFGVGFDTKEIGPEIEEAGIKARRFDKGVYELTAFSFSG
jgi:hypothetical protein